MYLDEAYPDYYIFGSTILLNGKKHYLTSVYDEEKKAFELLGARRILRNGQLDRDVKALKQGDFYCKPYTSLSHHMSPA
ncbi:MAG: hypothetical protein IJU00_13535 [Selenomonas sp.]|nr:hypothetical protein [Selenomonas sp.]